MNISECSVYELLYYEKFNDYQTIEQKDYDDPSIITKKLTDFSAIKRVLEQNKVIYDLEFFDSKFFTRFSVGFNIFGGEKFLSVVFPVEEEEIDPYSQEILSVCENFALILTNVELVDYLVAGVENDFRTKESIVREGLDSFDLAYFFSDNGIKNKAFKESDKISGLFIRKDYMC